MSSESEHPEVPIQKLVMDFLTDYFYCTLTQDRLGDRCRQFTRETDPGALRPILGDTLRLCSEVSARYPNLDAKANNLLARLQELGERNDGFMNDIAEAMGYRAEDRAMADDFSLCVLTRQIGQSRTPRQRVVVNPFEVIDTEDEQEEEILEEETEETPENEEESGGEEQEHEDTEDSEEESSESNEETPEEEDEDTEDPEDSGKEESDGS